MGDVHRRILRFDSFNRAVECGIEQVSAPGRVPLQPGVRSHIGDVTFADDKANLRGAFGPQDGVEQDGFALAIRGDIGVDLRRRFPLPRILIGDRAQAGYPLVESGDRRPACQGACGGIQDGRNRAHLTIVWSGGDR